MNSSKNINKKRIKNIIIFFITLLFILVLRISYITIINGKEYASMALEQWTSEKSIDENRGNILDRNGEILVLNTNLYKIDLNLDLIKEYAKNNNTSLENIAKSISEILDLTQESVLNKLNNSNNNLIVLSKNAEKEQATKIKDLGIDGITVTTNTKRYYPNNNFASHLLGNINSDGNGINGIESYYEKVLTGVPGISIQETNAYGGQLAYSESQHTEAVNGKDVTLTIDEKIQFFAEEVAKKAYKEQNPDSVTIVVMNPNNGEVLAMVNKPDFNPNDSFNNYSNFAGETDNDKLQNMWKNSAIAKTIEPGSIFKVITSAIALEENIAGNNEKYYCSGSLTIDNTTIKCWKGPEQGGHGLITLDEALESSCNVVFMEIASKLGKNTFNEYIEKFGLNELSGIDLPGEIKGITDKEYYTNSFHIPVNYNISIKDKIYIEAPYHKLCNAGHISYIELDDSPSPEVIMEIINYAYKRTNISYIGINFHIRYCKECGTSIENNLNSCPKCNSKNIQGISRVTGYLSLDERFGPGKYEERLDRRSHTGNYKNNY